MKKGITFQNIQDLLNHLESNNHKYKSTMIDFNSVLIGDIFIRRYLNIDPENLSEQYYIKVDDKEFKILPNNKIYSGIINENNFTNMNFSATEAEHMYYQIAIIFQEIVNKNFKKYTHRQQRHDFLLIFTATIVACLVNTCSHKIDKKIQDKTPAKKEKSIENTKPKITPVNTIMYNSVKQMFRE